jgi:Uma2 family endonuclease
VLDERQSLIVQPDLVFIQKSRESIIKRQVWGAPDLAIEVASRSTMVYDRTTKLKWYREYGVRECWLVLPDESNVGVVDFSRRGKAAFSWSQGDEPIRSIVLPSLDLLAARVFD